MKNKYIKIILCCFLALTSSFLSAQQNQVYTIKGEVSDEFGDPFIGVAVTIQGRAGVGVITNLDGLFEIKASKGDVLVFSIVGYKSQDYLVSDNADNVKITLAVESHELQEAVVTGMGSSQRRISIVGAVTSVNVDDLQTPATSVANMLGGRVAGIISRQNSGEPGKNTSEFWVRGISTFGAGQGALILIDGLEGSINNIDPSDIESFTVLKDASATAVYGTRGANGVVLVTTKRGTTDRLHITARVTSTFSYLSRMPKYVDAYNYAMLANEANVVRGVDPLYSDIEIDLFKTQLDPDLYPNVNWQKEVISRTSFHQQYYASARGGSQMARYFISLGYWDEDSAYKQDKNSKYSSKLGFQKLTYRSNVDMDITKTSVLSLNLEGEFTTQKEPGIGSTDNLWLAQQTLTAVSIPTVFSNGQFPGAGGGSAQYSPYVMLNHTGLTSKEYSRNLVSLSLNQKLDFITKGLKMRVQGALTMEGWKDETRRVRPALWKATGRRPSGDLIMIEVLPQLSPVFSTWQKQARQYKLLSTIDYETIIGEDHRISALLYYEMEDKNVTDQEEFSSLNALPFKYQGLSGRVTYGLKDTYFMDANFGYTGSANFKKNERFGFFPSAAIGWVPTQYDFVKEATPWMDFLKLRASYGLVGNDKITKARFPYLTIIHENLMTGWGYKGFGIQEGRIGADNLKWEKSKKLDVGIETRLLGEKMEIVADYFEDQRDGIFQLREQVPSYVGLSNMPFGNVGRMKSWGFDGQISYIYKFDNGMSLTARGNFTYATTKMQNNEESFKEYAYQTANGYPIKSIRGLKALGLFKDEEEIANSPLQTFSGNVMPGDIKYKDVNGDGVINSDDAVPLAYENIPRLQYGFGLEWNYKQITVGTRIKGTGRTDFYWGGIGYLPFQSREYGNVLELVANQSNRWTPASYSGDKATENPNARFPRLSYGDTANNSQLSSFWLGNASYLRLSEVSFNYRFAYIALKNIGVSSIDLTLTGTDLAVWDNVKIYDPELAHKAGTVYPMPTKVSAQIFINF